MSSFTTPCAERARLDSIQWALTYPAIMGWIDCQITEITGYIMGSTIKHMYMYHAVHRQYKGLNFLFVFLEVANSHSPNPILFSKLCVGRSCF